MKKIRVVIDPGHGGEDRWNRGPTGYIEADGVLKIARYLKEVLEKTGHFDVKLTRDHDGTLSRKQRAQIARDFQADLFISEHTNAFNGTVKGTEVFYSVKRPQDLALATKMSRKIAGHFQTNNRGGKTRINSSGEDYYGILFFGSLYNIPSILLVESLFHDHIKEEQILLQDENLRSLAKVQGEVIKAHFGIQDGESKYTGREEPVENTVQKEIRNSNEREIGNSVQKEKEPSKVDSKEEDPLDLDKLYRVQVGAFRDKENALRMIEVLENDGYPTYLVPPR